MAFRLDQSTWTLDATTPLLDNGFSAQPPYRQSHVDIALYRRSSDGLYWGRYPNGDKPPGMTASAAAAFSAAGLFTNKIRLSVAAAAAAQASATLAGPGLPGQVSSVTATAGPAGTAALLFAAPSSNGGSPLTQYEALSSPGGITASTAAITSPVSGLSQRIDVSGLTGGTSYTFQVRARNANGAGAYSSASSSITAAALANYGVACGYGTVGLRAAAGVPVWGNFGAGIAVAPGTLSQNGLATAPLPLTTGAQVIEVDVNSFDEFLPFYLNPQVSPPNGNGRFDTTGFSHLSFALWPITANYKAQAYVEASTWLNFMASGGSSSIATDATQNWPTNQFPSGGGWLFNDLDNNSVQNVISGNTATSLSIAGGGPVAAGHRCEIQQPDVGDGNAVQVGFGSSLYGPATMTAMAWNQYSIPWSAFGLTLARILKFAIQDQVGSPTVFYLCNVGFT